MSLQSVRYLSRQSNAVSATPVIMLN